MNTAPQAVTERYVTNLINYGRNREFDINCIAEREIKHDEVVVGRYYEVCVITNTREHSENASGATISQAVRRALEKHGVTFR